MALLSLLSMYAGQFCFGQTRTKPSASQFKSFKVIAPDTVEQGVPFHALYSLSATNWATGGVPKHENGFKTVDVQYKTIKGRPFSEQRTLLQLCTSGIGDMVLPSVVRKVSGKIVRSEEKHVFVKPHHEYGEEMAVAYKCLVSNGKDKDSVCLEMAQKNRHTYIFKDDKNNCFCLVTKHDVWPLVGNPVLAYSTESTLDTSINGVLARQALINPYDKQIDTLIKLRALPKTWMPQTESEERMVAPLLGNICWGQSEPYNSKAPTLEGKRVVIGCVPLAVCMILKYYNWPSTGESKTYYRINGTLYAIEFERWQVNWTDYADAYSKEDTVGAADLSIKLAYMALGLSSDLSPKATSAHLENVKHVMCNNLRYSSKLRYEQNATEELLSSVLYEELDNRRPCIVANDSHAFVCDGYKGDFLHFNLGWGGYCNGYYRLSVRNDLLGGDNSQLPVKSIIYGIEPRHKDVAKTVTLPKAGLLGSLLLDKEKHEVTELTIKGPLNSQDIKLLRLMAGARSESDTVGADSGYSLRSLDLSDATIVDDKQPYFVKKASGVWKHSYMNSFTASTTVYDFDNMTENEWKHFKSNIGARQDGFYYTRTENNHYWTHYYCQKGTVGNFMFYGCHSLLSVQLPKNTKAIGVCAFADCSSLQTIEVPAKTQSIGTQAFFNCLSLEQAEVPYNIQFGEEPFVNCSDKFRKPTYYKR